MEFNEYQKWTDSTAIYPKDKGIEYTTLGLAGESGELCNKVKKILRGDYSITPSLKNELRDELGDVCYYLARLATELELSLEDVFLRNVEKLNNRKQNNTLRGSGDNR